MPGMDGTGPQGSGPFGRGLGSCNGGQTGWGRGRGGFHRGGVMGWNRMAVRLDEDDEKKLLENQRSWLETQLESVSQRIQELNKSEEE